MTENGASRRDDAAAGFKVYRKAGASQLARAKERGSHRKGHDEHSQGEQGMAAAVAAGLGNGAVTRVIFSSPHLHITQAWFKSGFPLPLHSHDVDCFYHVVAGSLSVGSEELVSGDGVFIPGSVPYTFSPGELGAEILEIRTSDDFDTEFKANNAAYWGKIVAATSAAQERWKSEAAPLAGWMAS